ncbi:MAG: hypothetical protein ABJA49_09925 [Betaproteobacteria bacterium]
MAERQTTGAVAWIGQALLYAVFALLIGVFSSWPHYRYLEPGQALIKLSFNHQGKLVADCRAVSAEEQAKVQPTMRRSKICPRERSPITVELELDGADVLRTVAEPSGLSRDGASTTYHRIQVAAGTHQLVIRLKDDARSTGFDYEHRASVTLKPAQILVVDFDPAKGGITLR